MENNLHTFDFLLAVGTLAITCDFDTLAVLGVSGGVDFQGMTTIGTKETAIFLGLLHHPTPFGSKV